MLRRTNFILPNFLVQLFRVLNYIIRDRERTTKSNTIRPLEKGELTTKRKETLLFSHPFPPELNVRRKETQSIQRENSYATADRTRRETLEVTRPNWQKANLKINSSPHPISPPPGKPAVFATFSVEFNSTQLNFCVLANEERTHTRCFWAIPPHSPPYPGRCTSERKYREIRTSDSDGRAYFMNFPSETNIPAASSRRRNLEERPDSGDI